MGFNAGCQLPISLVSWLRNTGVQVYHQEDICLRGAAQKGLLQPVHFRMVIGRYVRPYYVPLIPLYHQHENYHIWSVIRHTLKLPSLLPLPHDRDASTVPDIRLCHPYGVAGDLPCVYPLPSASSHRGYLFPN